jgi:hypothetical protein
MLSFIKKSGLFSQTTSRSASSRRRGRTRLTLEALEGRALMSIVTGPPVPAPTPGTMPPTFIQPPNNLPPSNR